MDRIQHQGEDGTGALPSYRAWLCGPFRLERRVGSVYETVSIKEWCVRSSTP